MIKPLTHPDAARPVLRDNAARRPMRALFGMTISIVR